MSDIKWIKITTNMFEDEKIRLIDAMPERDTIHYIWIRLLVQAGKTNTNGFIFLNENIPYTDEMLATIFCRPLASIRLALKTLCDFEMIEITPDNIIKILNWDKHQNIEGMERVRAQNRKRVENHRDKKKQIEKTTKENNEEEKQNIDDVKVQVYQEENTKVSVEDNKNIVLLNNSEGNINTGEMEQGSDTGKCVGSNEANLDDCESVIKSTSKNYSNITNNACNVTHNESNVTVTKQNKKEIESKNKNKRKIENESNKITDDINNKGSTHDDEVKNAGIYQEVKGSNISKSENLKENPIAIAENDINSKAIELMNYHEKITGIVGGLNHVALRLAIDMHGEKNVKMAIDKALEVNKTDIRYINGILKNWRREGYPKEGDEIKNGVRSTGKGNAADKNEFTGFKPKKPRNLTETERKGAEEKLI